MRWEDYKREKLKNPNLKREYDALKWMMDIENIPLDPEYKAQLINRRKNQPVTCSASDSDRLVVDSVFKPLSV